MVGVVAVCYCFKNNPESKFILRLILPAMGYEKEGTEYKKNDIPMIFFHGVTQISFGINIAKVSNNRTDIY